MLMQTELVWLLGAVAKGDEAAFERLYDATRAKLYGVLLRILGRPALAEEVMQETYLKVWKMADHFDPAIASPITWMVAMARNRAIDIVRKKGEVSIEDEPEAMDVASEQPAAAGPPRNDRGTQTAVVLPRQARSGKAAHRVARLLQRLEPRSVGAEARHSGEHDQDLAPPQSARNSRVYGTLKPLLKKNEW
jgi:RNA polymerase sigma factor (sigma-70 family)